jgi:hypothetical protein
MNNNQNILDSLELELEKQNQKLVIDLFLKGTLFSEKAIKKELEKQISKLKGNKAFRKGAKTL